MNFAERVKCLRESRGMSQWQVAKRAGKAKSYISMIENGESARMV